MLFPFRWWLYYCLWGCCYTSAIQVVVILLRLRWLLYCCSSLGCCTIPLPVVITLLSFRWWLWYCATGRCFITALQMGFILLLLRWLFYNCSSSGCYSNCAECRCFTIALQVFVIVLLLRFGWLFPLCRLLSFVIYLWNNLTPPEFDVIHSLGNQYYCLAFCPAKRKFSCTKQHGVTLQTTVFLTFMASK
jgi:hypothetical protein